MNRQDYILKIIKLLTRLPKLVESCNKLNLTDINNFSEDFYENLLNLIYGYKLENANKFTSNAVAIDLRDISNELAIQVTSTSDLKKTKSTVEKFVENNLFDSYKRLVILNIVKKSTHKVRTLGNDNFIFDTSNDIWDIDDLLKDVKYLTDIDKLKLIHDFVLKELQDEPSTSLPNEVGTILSIIEFLSNEEHSEAGNGFIEEPDPENKIFVRFTDHSEFLTNRYSDLYIEYGKVLDAIGEENDIGSQSLRRAGTYLKGYSDEVLMKCNGDPVKALKTIVETIQGLLSNLGCSFDAGAAEFYIVDQLIKCNVFPNRQIQNG